MLKNVKIALSMKENLCAFVPIGRLELASLTACAEDVVFPSQISAIQVPQEPKQVHFEPCAAQSVDDIQNSLCIHFVLPWDSTETAIPFCQLAGIFSKTSKRGHNREMSVTITTNFRQKYPQLYTYYVYQIISKLNLFLISFEKPSISHAHITGAIRYICPYTRP